MERNTDTNLTEASLILDLLPYNPNNINLTFNVKKKHKIVSQRIHYFYMIAKVTIGGSQRSDSFSE